MPQTSPKEDLALGIDLGGSKVLAGVVNGSGKILGRGKLKTPLKILTPKSQIEEIRKNLKPLLKEIEHTETFVDTIEKFLRF